MQGGEAHIKELLNQRYGMITNGLFALIKQLRLFMGDLQLHVNDLDALDWSEIDMPVSTKRRAIMECWARFYTDFYLN